MFARLMVLLSVLGSPSALPAFGQTVDPASQAAGQSVVPKLEKAAQSLLPKGAKLSVWAEDGRVYARSVDLTPKVDFAAMGREGGINSRDVGECVEAWSSQLAGRLGKLTADAVAKAGTDKDFNPNLDVTLNVSGHILPPAQQAKGGRGDFYFISFTGTRRNPETDEKGNITRLAPGDPTGGEIKITLEPDRAVWGYRQTITGRITITNTGKSRVHLDAWHVNAVDVTDAKGKSPPSFSILGFIDPPPNAARYIFLKPGETHVGQFSVFADRAYSMRNGYYLGEGEWLLRGSSWTGENLVLTGDAARVTVRAKPGEYMGARIVGARGAGSRLLIEREDDVVETFDVASGARLGSRRLGVPVSGWNWRGYNPTFSTDGRLVAYCKDPEGPIVFQSLFGKEPDRPALVAPAGVKLGQGGFTAQRFSPDDAQLICQTNGKLVVMDLATGRMVRTIPVPEMWVEASPDATAGAVLLDALGGVGGYRGKDRAALGVLDLSGPAKMRRVTIKGHGEHPDIHAGRSGVYLCDEFASAALFVPYGSGAPLEFKTEAPSEFVGESPDGTIAAFSWPRAEPGKPGSPTSVGIYRVADGARLATITAREPQAIVLVADPLRIVMVPRLKLDVDWGYESRFAETASVFDALAGKPIKTVDLTPR